ncbi:MAG: hypothetical protein CTY37_03915 [Methylotenera sp.]|nr:MAG: hypothetical protein CTY37_03915 [Methylotenera sp.]PPD18316.1 MAG: hypothetical protein CTY27_01940 [Methylotenera sp.]
MKFTYLFGLLAAFSLAGCATNIPQAENFPASQQKKAVAIQHWGVIADDAIAQTKLSLAKQNITKSSPLFVADNNKTDFSRAFRKYMIAGLIDDGFVVSAKKEGAIEIDYEAQVIRHAGAFDPLAFGYKPGVATAGVAGFWVLRDALKSFSFSSAGLGSLAVAGAYDVYKAKNPGETPVELLISTSIIERDRYVMLNADAYYIEKGEALLFEECKSKNKRLCR